MGSRRHHIQHPLLGVFFYAPCRGPKCLINSSRQWTLQKLLLDWIFSYAARLAFSCLVLKGPGKGAVRLQYGAGIRSSDGACIKTCMG